jgi:hypothetical protein
VANNISNNVSILKNSGDGTFQTKVDYAVGIGPQFVFCADLDGDSDWDMAVVNMYGDSVSILLNNTIVVGVEDEEDSDQRPERFSLSQNCPNPFNPTTALHFTVHSPQSAVHGPIPTRLIIYNVLGQKVRTLVDEPKRAGSYTVIWDGTDEQGNDVASGVYFYKLRVGDYSQTKKMVFLK